MIFINFFWCIKWSICDLLTRADDRDWTGDLFLTKEVLYQLSYISIISSMNTYEIIQSGRRKLNNWPIPLCACLRRQGMTLPTLKKKSIKIIQSGRRDSNSRPTAWKAVTLPTELLPQFQWSMINFQCSMFFQSIKLILY